MKPSPDDAPVSRSDLRHAIGWVLAARSRLAFVVALLLASGLLSVFGRLTWDGPFMRWSFAALCWASAGALLVAYRQRRMRAP